MLPSIAQVQTEQVLSGKSGRTLGRVAPGRKSSDKTISKHWFVGAAASIMAFIPAIALAEIPPVPAKKPITTSAATPIPETKPGIASHDGPPLPTAKPTATRISAVETPTDTLTDLLPTLSADDKRVYEAAFEAIERKEWNEAYRLAQQAEEPAPRKLINWLRLSESTRGDNLFSEIGRFIKDNPDWPGQRTLERQAEKFMPASMSDRAVIDWFRAAPPQTLDGTRRYVAALERQNLTAEAKTAVRQRWIDGPVPLSAQRKYVGDYKKYLTRADHENRLDRLIWDGHYDAAEGMLRYAGDDLRVLATARIQLALQQPGVDAAISRVPARLQNDPGLLFERARWRRKKSFNDGAADLILAADGRDTLQSVWWAEREIMARRMLDGGVPGVAYKIASEHAFESGIEFANLEWLSGWIALRALNRPALALTHFEKLYAGVETPISKARGAYWAGRAAEALQKGTDSFNWYGLAAENPTTYYGQLAANRLQYLTGKKVPANLDLQQEQPLERAERVAFSQNEYTRLVGALNQLGERGNRQVPMFMAMLRRTATSEADYRMIGELAMAMKRPSEAIATAKAAAQNGFQLAELGSPRLEFSTDPAVETALIHALIRQESGFNPLAQSRVGALGLMQLMPSTAQQVARKAGRQHSTAWLLSRPDYNVLLGTMYLSSLLERFDGSYVLALAGYNAGPTRVSEWIAQYGDPREGAIDVIDWIERIPYRETRNYVQRILEATQVYRARMAGGTAPITIDHDLLR